MPYNFGSGLELFSRATDFMNGYNESIDESNGTSTLWNGPTVRYVYPSDAGETMEVVSTDVGDVGIHILVVGLDGNGLVITDLVVSNGTTPVPLNFQFSRINRVLVYNDIEPVGEVHVCSVGGVTTYGLIHNGDNQSSQLIYTVPADRRAVFLDGVATINRDGEQASTLVILSTWVKERGRVPWRAGRWGLQHQGSSAFTFVTDDRPVLPPLTDIEITAEVNNNKTDVSGRVPFALIRL